MAMLRREERPQDGVLGAAYNKHKPRRRKGDARGSHRVYLGVFCVLAFLTWYARSGPKGLRIVPMPRIPAGSLTKKEFFKRYGDKTVIIEGGLRHHPAFGLGLERLRDLCQGIQVETFVYDPKSREWGGHVDEKVMPFEDYIDKYVLNETNNEKRYMPGSGLGIPLLCPTLELLAPIPNYLSFGLADEPAETFGKWHERLNETGDGELDTYRPLMATEPAIYVGPGDTKTEIHMDSFPGTFWMAVYFGKKMFRTISYEDSIKHMPYFTTSSAARFQKWGRNTETGKITKKFLEIWNPDLETFPELKKVTIWEGTVSAGDWIYVPPATLHGVYNPEPFWALEAGDILPPLFNKYVDACVETNLMGRCRESLVAIGLGKCDPYHIKERGKLKKCLRDSLYVDHVQKQYDEDQATDRFVHQHAGYDGFQPWCEAICKAHPDHKNVCAACQEQAQNQL